MKIVVQKYGGSSVATVEKINDVADKIIAKKNEGYSVVVVVSAMGKTTNNLIDMANEISKNPSKREMDMLMSTGEQVSISLLSIALIEKGYDAISLTGMMAGIKTFGKHTKSKISNINNEAVVRNLQEGKIVIVAGFQGYNEFGEITTLGRGGSDTSAVAIASSLNCTCEIYTDVDGIYNIDPRLYKNSKKLDFISYEEMMELSSLGAKVMEPRSVEIAARNNVKLYVASSINQKNGTYIKEFDESMEENIITGISVTEDVVMVTFCNINIRENIISKIFNLVAGENINVDMISQTAPIDGMVDVSFTAPLSDLSTIEEISKKFIENNDKITYQSNTDVIKLSLVGYGMRNQSGVVSKVFDVFDKNSINFYQVTTSEISISFILNKKDKELAIDSLTKEFNM